jgi:thioredoxin-related protein
MFTMRRSLILTLAIASVALASSKPPNAEQILAGAESSAAEQHKSIFLIFGASWCGPCHELDTFLDAPEIHPIIDKAFVIVKLHVAEQEGKNPGLNTAGGERLMFKFAGRTVENGTGVPYIVFLDAKGEPIVNSDRPIEGDVVGANIGYPAAPEEIDWFMVMLKKGAPTLSADDARIVEDWLRRHGTGKSGSR